LVDLQQTIFFTHVTSDWSDVGRSQDGKFTGQRPTFCHCAMPPTKVKWLYLRSKVSEGLGETRCTFQVVIDWLKECISIDGSLLKTVLSMNKVTGKR